jgi:uncharacterized protein (DUF2267 family)
VDQAAAFQKIWLDSISKLMQTAFTFGTESAPPEFLREIRSGIFQAWSKSWEEYMRSPQFLESMKQWMDQAISFRKISNDFMANVRNEFQATSREDIDNIMLAVRHMEKRLLDRVEALSAQVDELQEHVGNDETKRPAAKAQSPKPGQPKYSRKPSRGNGKVKAL